MPRFLSLLCALLLSIGLFSCACAGERDVVGYDDFLTDLLAASYQEPSIIFWNGFGPWDGRPDGEKGVYAVCLSDCQNTYWLSIFEKQPNDETYVLSGELKDARFRGGLPTNLFVELNEANSSKEYLLTYGYDMDETYIQVECHSLVGSKEWTIKSFSVHDKKAETYGFIDFAPAEESIVVYTDVPIEEGYKHHTPACFCGDSDGLFSTAFSEIDVERLFSLLTSPSP